MPREGRRSVRVSRGEGEASSQKNMKGVTLVIFFLQIQTPTPPLQKQYDDSEDTHDGYFSVVNKMRQALIF